MRLESRDTRKMSEEDGKPFSEEAGASAILRNLLA